MIVRSMYQQSLFPHRIYDTFCYSLHQWKYRIIQQNTSAYSVNFMWKKKKKNLKHDKIQCWFVIINTVPPVPEGSWNSECDGKLKQNIF